MTRFAAPAPYAASDYEVRVLDLESLDTGRALYGIYAGATFFNRDGFLGLIARIASLAIGAPLEIDPGAEPWTHSLVVLQAVASTSDIYDLYLRLEPDGPAKLRIIDARIDVFDLGRLRVEAVEGTIELAGDYADLHTAGVAVVQRTLKTAIFDPLGVGIVPEMTDVAAAIGVPASAMLWLDVTFTTAERGEITLANQFAGFALGLTPAAAQTLATP